jgi:hypothetical protein
MRMMLRVTPGIEKGNKTAKEGTLGQIMGALMEQIKPEAAYFAPHHGRRTAYMFFDLKDPSQIPSIAEPLFDQLDAEFELTPCMNAAELKTGLEAVKRR